MRGCHAGLHAPTCTTRPALSRITPAATSLGHCVWRHCVPQAAPPPPPPAIAQLGPWTLNHSYSPVRRAEAAGMSGTQWHTHSTDGLVDSLSQHHAPVSAAPLHHVNKYYFLVRVHPPRCPHKKNTLARTCVCTTHAHVQVRMQTHPHYVHSRRHRNMYRLPPTISQPSEILCAMAGCAKPHTRRDNYMA